MNIRLRRRRFGQLAIASATSAAIASVMGKSIAQQSQSILYGVSLTAKNSNSISKAINTTDIANTTPGISVVSIDLVSGKNLSTFEVAATTVENSNISTETGNKAIYSNDFERITAFTIQPDGTFIIVAIASGKKGNFNRIITVDSKSVNKVQKGLKLSGFKQKNSTVESLLVTRDKKVLSVISLNEGTPPFELSNFDLKTGKLSSNSELPQLATNLRFSNLSQGSDGIIYATVIGSEGIVSLVQLDLVNKSLITGKARIVRLSDLTFNSKPLKNDLLSLAVSSSNQIFALFNQNTEVTNSLFTVDPKTGEMKLLKKLLNVDKIAFAPS